MSKFTWHEVIRVDSPIFLVSSKHRACHYETSDDKPLVPGHYLALWPSRARRAFYGRDLKYFGPFATQTTAQLLQSSALAWGIVVPVPGTVEPLAAAPAESNRQQWPLGHGGALQAVGEVLLCA